MPSKIKEVKDLYTTIPNVGRLARKTGLSECVVLRMLITSGIYPTPRAKEIARLRLIDLTTEEIARYLQIRPKTVKNYYPYQRGTYCDYAEQKSENAKKIAEWRHRKRDGLIE